MAPLEVITPLSSGSEIGSRFARLGAWKRVVWRGGDGPAGKLHDADREIAENRRRAGKTRFPSPNRGYGFLRWPIFSPPRPPPPMRRCKGAGNRGPSASSRTRKERRPARWRLAVISPCQYPRTSRAIPRQLTGIPFRPLISANDGSTSTFFGHASAGPTASGKWRKK